MNHTSSMAPMLADYHKNATNLRLKILKSEEERIQLEQKLRSLSTIDSRLKQHEQVDQIQTYFKKLNEESQRAQQRNSSLLNDITKAEHSLTQLRLDVERLISLQTDYLEHVQSTSSSQPKPASTNAIHSLHALNPLNRQSADDLHRQSVPTSSQSSSINQYLPYQNYENVSKNIPDRTNLTGRLSHHEEQSLSDSTTATFSRSKRSSGSLRMKLSRSGLQFLLHYLESEFKSTIDKRRIYQQDSPTIAQKRSVLDIANGQQQFAIKDLEPTTTSMVIFDLLPSTIRDSTVNKCLLSEKILLSNVKDLDKDTIANMLHEQDRSLWVRLIEHFTHLLKHHIMNSQTIAYKFAPILLPENALSLHEKAKSVLKHILDNVMDTQQTLSTSDDETPRGANSMRQLILKAPINPQSSSLNRMLAHTNDIEYDDSSASTSAALKKNRKTTISEVASPRTTNDYDDDDDDDDYEFYH